MKDRSPFKAQCWELAKDYFKAMDKDHIIRMIERAVELENESKT